MKAELFSLHSRMEERHWWFLGRRRIAGALVGHLLPPRSQGVIVDVGCGTGGNLTAWSEEYPCIGIDASAEAIRRARDRNPKARFFTAGHLGDLSKILNQGDLLLLMDVLEHLPDDFLFLSELMSMAKPGAVLLLTVPADMSLWSPHDVSFGHYRRYDRKRLERLWEGLPLTPLLVSHYNSRLYPIVRGIRFLNRIRRKTDGLEGTDFRLPPAPINRVLEKIFAGEAKALVDLLSGKRRQGYPFGVSLIALLRREAGPLQPRHRPVGHDL